MKKKSHRGARKRMRLTAKGKVRRFRAYKSHILTKKSRKRKRRLRRPTVTAAGDARRMKRLIQA
jgi:large subunit ribosomal protein L35